MPVCGRALRSCLRLSAAVACLVWQPGTYLPKRYMHIVMRCVRLCPTEAKRMAEQERGAAADLTASAAESDAAARAAGAPHNAKG